MAQVRQTMHSCDVCGRVAYTKEDLTADGWRKLKIWNEGLEDEPDRWQDACDGCSSVLRDAIVVRRRAEKGKHVEPKRKVYPPTPDQANAIASAQLYKASTNNT